MNYEGSLNVLRACKKAGVRKLVMSSSPSTRFDGSDVDGLTEEQMPPLPQKRYLQTYAETKAMGEKAVTDACCSELLTCAVAPHQAPALPCAFAALPDCLGPGPRVRP